MLRAYGISDKGRVRPTNEDCFAIDEALGLCVVADGMGGHAAGEIAARIAVETVVEAVAAGPSAGGWPFGCDATLSPAGNLLRTAILLANVQILERAIGDDACAGMGTTIVAALVAGGVLSAAHVGDSRLYLAAGARVRQLTRDDSWVATVLDQDPSADLVLLRHHPMRNALTNVVGARPGTEVHVVEEPLAGGEVLLLSTDGIHGTLDGPRLDRLLLDPGDVRDIAAALVDAAIKGGSRDNCTAVVARCGG